MKQNPDLVIRLYDALKRIACYETSERLLRHGEKAYGIPGQEALEYAYDNVLHEAKRAIKGVRRPVSAALVRGAIIPPKPAT